ncbi:MAG: hypothetical protein OSB63_06435 [Planctomycetota bacterium]|nr:hypothetical protein [Planctomycetota bacterium]
MKFLLSFIAAVCCVGALSAQTTVLSEDFNANIVPPAGWITQNLNGNTMFSEPWNTDGMGNAWHGDGGSADGQAENMLATPALDLTGMTEAHFHMDVATGWVMYMAHTIAEGYGYGNGVTTVEASTDGGATWTAVWTDDILVADDQVLLTVDVDMSAYAGQSNVMMGVHFSGDWAHEMWIDSVTVDDQAGGGGGGGLTYAITPMTAGAPVTFSITGAAPNSNCIIGYSLAGAGPINTAYGVVDMTPPISTLANIPSNASGDASLTVTVPANASGVTLYTQALNNGVLTNSLAETVQ